MDFGFIRVAAAIPSVKVADCTYNIAHIEPLIRQAAQQGAAVVALPELSITGYTCADLFNQPFLLQQAEIALGTLLQTCQHSVLSACPWLFTTSCTIRLSSSVKDIF